MLEKFKKTMGCDVYALEHSHTQLISN